MTNQDLNFTINNAALSISEIAQKFEQCTSACDYEVKLIRHAKRGIIGFVLKKDSNLIN